MDQDLEAAAEELNRIFSEPLREFHKRRIIFWYDEDQQFKDKISELKLENAEVLILNPNNNFKIKKLLTSDNQNDNFCVYVPIIYPEEENWLLPIQLYSDEYHSDLISRWINEMKLENTENIRKVVKDYQVFFRTKAHRGKIQSLKNPVQTPVQLRKAAIAVLCGVKDTNPNVLIRAVLSADLDIEKNGLYQSLVKNKLDTFFWAMVQKVTGYCEDEVSLQHLACHILATAAVSIVDAEIFAGNACDKYISEEHTSYCYDLITEWPHSDKKDRLWKIARYAEKEFKLSNRLSLRKIEEYDALTVFPCVDENILIHLMNEIKNGSINPALIKKTAEKRRHALWYNRFENYYNGIVQIADMREFYLKHSEGFHTVEAPKVWEEYTSDYYRMDNYYRLFHISFKKSRDAPNPFLDPRLDDFFKDVDDTAENLYKNWFLEKLGENWTTACAEDLEKYGKIIGVTQQNDFYNREVKNFGRRVFVIISDALRYEVAVSLAEGLRLETQAEVKLKSMQAIYPSVTKFGMAALLPHKELTAEVKEGKPVEVLVDGLSASAPNRTDILKKANHDSAALKYNDIIKMKRSQRSECVKGKEVIYIYHDEIDNTGHDNEELTFTSCDKAIKDVKNMVRIITNEFSGTNIIITSDHGFLYTFKALEEDSKVDKTTAASEDIEVDRRYLITKKGAKPEYLLPVKFIDDENYNVFTPRPNMRIKKKGGSVNYVHGGISLQELVVPVIEYHYLRNDSQEYQRNKSKYDTKPVGLTLLSSSHKISNRVFSLNFYQTEEAAGVNEAAKYKLYFEDSNGNIVSDIRPIIADKTSKNNKERTFKAIFSLKSIKFSSDESYYLVIHEESGMLKQKKEEFTIDIPLAFDDIDFFK